MPDISYPEQKYEEYQDSQEKNKSPVKNVNQWAILIITIATMLTTYLIMISGGVWYHYGIMIALAITAIILLTNAKQQGGYMDATEAETLAWHIMTYKQQEGSIYEYNIPKGEIRVTAAYPHTHPIDATLWRYEIGCRINTGPHQAPYYCSLTVDALRNGTGFIGYSPRYKPYLGEPYLIIRQKVPVSEVRYWRQVPGVNMEGQ